MAQQNLQESKERILSRVDQALSFNMTAISEYHTVESSRNSTANPSLTTTSSSSVYYSTRMQSMIDNRGNCSSEVDFDIEYSRAHWSELTDSDTDNDSTRLTNREYFELVLKNHPQWGGFFKDVKVVLGKTINEGGQAEIYDAKVEFADGRKFEYGYHVVKVMKGDCPLQVFQKQWPLGMLRNVPRDTGEGPLMWIEGGTLIDDRFSFVMVKQWGDLRKLIALKKQRNNRGPPFEDVAFIKKVMLCIATDMRKLHTKYKIVHRDLKASNVLLWSVREELPDIDPYVQAHVGDYECSVGVVGTGFWRAPEILQQFKDRVPSSEVVISKMSDIYSYGMTCYELLTGCIPFEGHPVMNYDLVLHGNRPKLSIADTFDHYCITEIIKCCRRREPLERPTFSEIEGMLLAANQAQFLGRMYFIREARMEEAFVRAAEALKGLREARTCSFQILASTLRFMQWSVIRLLQIL